MVYYFYSHHAHTNLKEVITFLHSQGICWGSDHPMRESISYIIQFCKDTNYLYLKLLYRPHETSCFVFTDRIDQGYSVSDSKDIKKIICTLKLTEE